MTNNTNQATVLTPDAYISSLSQDVLADQWWQALSKIPYAEHFGAFDDTTDPLGRRGSVEKALLGQPLTSGNSENNVLFIGGTFGDLPQGVGGAFTVNRSIVLPKDTTKIFFPILNLAFDNLTIDISSFGEFDNDTLKMLAAFYMNQSDNPESGTGVSKLFASIDGISVNSLYDYRQQSPGVNGFSYVPISGSMAELYFGYQPDTSYLSNPELAGLYPGNPGGYPSITDLGGYGIAEIGPAFADGYWLGVDLGKDEHTLNFGGTIIENGKVVFDLDITYNILNSIYGTNQKDNLNGTKGNDYIDGGNGKDSLFGCNGDDLIVGGNGADVLDGGKGNDELWGDAGPDTFIFRQGYGEDAIYDFERIDKIDIQGLEVSRSGISTVRLDSGLSATRIDFGGEDKLTLVGIDSDSLHIRNGVITL